MAVADPGFPRGGGANSPGGRQHAILPKFPKKCMKSKEFGSPGGGGVRPLRPPLDPPLNAYHITVTMNPCSTSTIDYPLDRLSIA